MSEILKTFRENTYVTKEFNDFLGGLISGVSGDIDAAIIPAEADALEVTNAELDAGYEFEVEIRIINDDGNVLNFYNGELNVIVVNDSGAGTVAINEEDAGAGGANVNEDLKFNDGVLKFKITTGGTWDDTDDDKIEITLDDADVEILGVSVKTENHKVLEAIAKP